MPKAVAPAAHRCIVPPALSVIRLVGAHTTRGETNGRLAEDSFDSRRQNKRQNPIKQEGRPKAKDRPLLKKELRENLNLSKLSRQSAGLLNMLVGAK